MPLLVYLKGWRTGGRSVEATKRRRETADKRGWGVNSEKRLAQVERDQRREEEVKGKAAKQKGKAGRFNRDDGWPAMAGKGGGN